MTIRRFSSRTHRLDHSFLLEHLKGARSYKRIAGYFTSSLFEVANELLEEIPEVKIVCNVDIHPDDLRVAQLREAKMLGRWNERALEAEALLNRDRYRRLDAFLQKHGHAVRVAPDSVCGFLHGKAGVIELADGRKLGFIGSMNETRAGWQRHYEILWEDDSPEGVAWIEAEFEYLWNAASVLPRAVIREVRRRGFRIMVATDAACEGLNLQTLGTLINVDLPWNPTRLEQRIGRIKRFGQAREKVDMLNLVNEQTVDEKVYDRLSERMRDRYNLFGSLPDTIKDEWIENIETLGEKMDEYINAQKEATGFDLRYTSTMEPSEKDWRDCTDVLSRRDLAGLMSKGWSEKR